MAASVVDVRDTITKITERMSCLRVFGHKKTFTENIKRHLLTIKEVADHNDTNAATLAKPGWIIDVADTVTDLWDLLDDHDLPSHSNLLFSLCSRTSHNLFLQLEKIEKRLQHITENSTKSSLKNIKRLSNLNRQTKIVGSGYYSNKDAILSQFLSLTKVEAGQGAIQVATIVGMQGTGKTTLAKWVCADNRVKSNFDLMIWIDGIRDEFYVESIVKLMVHQSTLKKKLRGKDFGVTDANLDLKEAMSGSRFLLVLDGFENENREEWLRLRQILTEAASSCGGGAVLVTTRNTFVANVVSSYTRRLYPLNEKDSWNLFEQVAGGYPSESKITDALKEMVKKCRGVPIAILTMARMLKPLEEITEAEIEHLEEKFMKEMQLIYYNELPSLHLKQCFAYLSLVFSSTEEAFYPETITRLWTAEYSNSSSTQPADFGLDCIQEFGRRSIMRVIENEYGIFIRCYINNELILDLSRFVAGKGCFCVDDRDQDVKETVRRVSLTRDFDVTNGIPNFLIKNNKNLRTILFPLPNIHEVSTRIPYEVKLSWSACHAIFRACKSLRVLNLSDLGMKVLPVSIGELKSLRHLDLSDNNIEKLPNSIGKLNHLQTLILSNCHQLRELPKEVKRLTSLRHLDMRDCLHLTHMPPALKKLTDLQTLSHFVASSTSNNHKHKHKHTGGISELVNLNKLRGKLEISHLERLQFKESEQDGHAYLKEKQHLNRLTLQWNHDDDDDDEDNGSDDNDHDRISLGHLEPHLNLQVLRIVGYRGSPS